MLVLKQKTSALYKTEDERTKIKIVNGKGKLII